MKAARFPVSALDSNEKPGDLPISRAALERVVRVEHSQKISAASRLGGFSDGVGALSQSMDGA